MNLAIAKEDGGYINENYTKFVEYTEGCKSRYTVLLCITLVTVYLLLHPSVCFNIKRDRA